MMKLILSSIVSLFFILTSFSQTIEFTLADPQPTLIEVYGGSFASGDIDGDGDIDLLISGLDPGRETALYLNDGIGNFSEVTTIPFPEASATVSIFEDLDGDGDLDLFFSGNGQGVGEFAHIYINDGSGTFTQLVNPDIPQFQDGAVGIADVDGDGNPDILISTEDANGVFIADVYLNDGNANFTVEGITSITPVKFGALAFIDVENDGDQDVIISGLTENNDYSTRLYLNDGLGNFNVDTNSTFEQLQADDIDVADTDNDGDLDILFSGRNDDGVFTLLYVNEGNGQFDELNPTNLQQTFAGTNAIADLDNDGDQDIVIIGSQEGGLPNIFNIVYQNQGNNEFTQADMIGGEYIAACAVNDFNGDGLLDIIIQGFVDNTNVYWNSSMVLGIDEVAAGFPIATIYPNPSDGAFFVQSNSSQMISMELFTVEGQRIYQNNGMSGMEPIQLNHLSEGLYLAVFTTATERQSFKILISK